MVVASAAITSIAMVVPFSERSEAKLKLNSNGVLIDPTSLCYLKHPIEVDAQRSLE